MTPTLALLREAARAVWVTPDPPAPEEIFLDTFSDSNGTVLAAHTPDIPLSMWTGGGADVMEIQDNKLQGLLAGNDYAVADMGISDYLITLVAYGVGSTTVVVRWVNSTNHWRCLVASGGVLRIQKVEGGSITTVAESAPLTPTNPTSMGVLCSGDLIEINALGGTLQWPTASFQNTATKVGLRGASSQEYDDFSVSTVV